MRVFLAIVGLLLLLSLGSQAIRHGFWRYTAGYRSALEPYAEPTEQIIAESKSIDELVELYAAAHKEVQQEKLREGSQPEREYERREREPYKSEELLESAIETWESHQLQIYEVQFLWWSGALFCVVGAFVISRVEWWLGLSLMILGFVEMNYATCPSFALGDANVEFLRLLTYKLTYSIAAVAMLLAAWWFVWQLLPARFPPRTAESPC
jgi:hypothetical protein